MRLRAAFGSFVMLGISLAVAREARAATGICDSNPPTSTAACTAQIQNAGTVVEDIFKDTMGRTGFELPVFGKIYNAWPGCNAPSAGCAGSSLAPYDCPGQYACASVASTFANAATYMNALDRLWWQPCRITDHTLDANGCPKWNTCIADGVGGSYYPWEGLVFDLGGPSNKVALFAENDHGPQPCESLEYSVYLSDNPLAREAITDPLVAGVDPQKWNRAVLAKIYTKGFVEVRPPDPVGHAACGDTSTFSVEEDSFVQVFSLPCGITFRYAAVIAGNDALDFSACGYDSSEAEVDAVAGLTEQGAGVCPDADGDHFVDCACPGAPSVCDCKDDDAAIHPGAPESCDSPDLNCDGVPGTCSGTDVCYQSVCREPCTGEFCGNGDACVATGAGSLCLPSSCVQGGCPGGQTCVSGSCVPSCTGVVCPGGQTCQDGNCVDLCAATVCPSGQQCAAGVCGTPCTCLQGDLGCATAGTVCDPSGACVPSLCKGVTCSGAERCDPATGGCVAQCTGVTCPSGQTCLEGQGCVPRCKDVTCTGAQVCDPADGACKDQGCVGVSCAGGLVCMGGTCVDTDAGMLPDAMAASPDAGAGSGTPSKGCCDVGGGAPTGSALLGAAVIAMLARRRRYRSLP